MSPGPPSRDRRQLLLAPGAHLNGIDYVEVGAEPARLRVHFLNTVTVRGSLSGTPPVMITGGPPGTRITIQPINEETAWSSDNQGRPVLALWVSPRDDLSTYRLTLVSSRLDPFFDQALFSFRAATPTLADCGAPAPACPETPGEPVIIDYLAKDFTSFTQALSEFSAQRYPAWVERSEADLGVMLMEALAAMADELSYYQDRVLAEATLVTATQRLSLLRHARLVDYEPAPATVATVLLQLDVSRPAVRSADLPRTSWTIDTHIPLLVQALGADGSIIDFEIEDWQSGLAGSVSDPAPSWATVDTRWNRRQLPPYYWDDSERWLLTGAEDFYIRGRRLGLYPGQQLLLDPPPASSADPPVRELVTVLGTEETSDPLYGDPPPTHLTRVFLQTPTTQDHDLGITQIAGNLVPAVQGQRATDTFVIPDPAAPSPGPVVVRAGANWTPQDPRPEYRYCLAASPLAWLATTQDVSPPARPEIVLSEVGSDGGTVAWAFEHWLLDAAPADQVFTLTPEQYSRVLISNQTTWFDYDGDGGTTIRFSDGTFGRSPLPGTKFTVTYRVGGGSAGNVPADAITGVAATSPQAALIRACTNPFPAAGGADAETNQQIRDRAPRNFSATPPRVVLAQDYQATAESLPWVQRARAAFRWTGSWLTAFTEADPAGAEEPAITQLQSLTALLNQQRLAGYESYVLPPGYVSIDLRITVTAKTGYFPHDLTATVRARLRPGTIPGGTAGFFDHSHWTFGQPLEPNTLLAAIQSCAGVDGVSQILYRRHGARPGWTALAEPLRVGPGQILRVDDDPARPDAGSLHVRVVSAA